MADEFLGRGWKFPIQVDRATGKLMMVAGEEDVAESIRVILRTNKGERIMRSAFGCDLSEFVFDTTDETTLHLIETNIAQAIRDWEPRVDQVAAEVFLDENDVGRMMISVSYRVRRTNNLFNQVYPFYLTEGSH